jgi:hypothetical protein
VGCCKNELHGVRFRARCTGNPRCDEEIFRIGVTGGVRIEQNRRLDNALAVETQMLEESRSSVELENTE